MVTHSFRSRVMDIISVTSKLAARLCGVELSACQCIALNFTTDEHNPYQLSCVMSATHPSTDPLVTFFETPLGVICLWLREYLIVPSSMCSL
jgi:hypothetical protein